MTETPATAPKRRSALPFVIGGAVVLGALVGGGTVLLLTSGGDPTSVRDVADQAVDAAEALDVDAGIDLLCSPPSAEDRDFLDQAIEVGRTVTGTDSPDVSYDISNVEGDATGTFTVTITSSEDALEGVVGTVDVVVGRDGERSCIESFEDRSIDQDEGDDFVVE